MNSTFSGMRFFCLFVVCTMLAAVGQTCRGDLFALMTNNGGIVRMDSTTGAVIDTYPTTEPTLFGQITPDTGLAFDGRNLYLNLRLGPGFEELWMFHVSSETWFHYGLLETISIDPFGPAERITGLGYMTDEFNQPALVAVTRREAGPAHIVQYVLGPPFADSLPVLPAGELPATIDPRGLDFDPETSQIWMTNFEGNPTGLATLKRIDLDGTIIETLSLPDDVPNFRGVGFDGGKLFIGGRNFVSSEEMVLQINRTTGEVLNSFVIPGPGTVAALAGGTVVPEPTTMLCAAVAFVLGGSRGSRRSRSDR